MAMARVAAPSSNDAPLSHLPRLAATTAFLGPPLSSAVLIVLLGLDAWKSFRRKTHWIPAQYLILGALSLQLLSLLNTPIVTIADDDDLTKEKVNFLWIRIDYLQPLILSGRVVMCVFIGSLLPEVARPRSTNLWSDMLALLISASGAVVHVSYEIYIVVINNLTQLPEFRWGFRIIFLLVSNIIIFVSIILLVLLLGCAAFASKSIQEVVAQRIPVVLTQNSPSDSRETSWKTLQEKVVMCWIMVRTSDPQYLIARSALSASTGFVVTICVPIFVVELAVNAYRDGFALFAGLGFIELALKCVFILLGWTIVWWRWLTAVVYYPGCLYLRPYDLKPYFRVEDFWTRSLVELEEEIKPEESYLKLVFSFIKRLRLHKLLPAFVGLQILLVLISKFCWLISEFLFSKECIRRLIMGSQGYREFTELYQQEDKGIEQSSLSVKYLQALICLPDENPASVWVANRKSIEDAHKHIEEAESKIKDYEPLISLLREKASPGFVGAKRLEHSLNSAQKLPVELYFNVGRPSAKMTAASLIAIMIQLSTLHEENEFPSSDIRGQDALTACSKAWKMISVIEDSETGATYVNKAADAVLRSLRESKWLDIQLPIRKTDDGDLSSGNAAREAVRMLAEKGEEMAANNSKEPHDSRNWKAVMAGVSLYKVCTAINCSSSDNVEDPLGEIRCLLADVLGSCIRNNMNVLVGKCRRWAETYEEKKVWEAVKVSSVWKGIMEAVGWDPPQDDSTVN